MVLVKRRIVGRGGHDLGPTETIGNYPDRFAAAAAIREHIRRFPVFGPKDDSADDPGNEGNYWFARNMGEFVVYRYWIEG